MTIRTVNVAGGLTATKGSAVTIGTSRNVRVTGDACVQGSPYEVRGDLRLGGTLFVGESSSEMVRDRANVTMSGALAVVQGSQVTVSNDASVSVESVDLSEGSMVEVPGAVLDIRGNVTSGSHGGNLTLVFTQNSEVLIAGDVNLARGQAVVFSEGSTLNVTGNLNLFNVTLIADSAPLLCQSKEFVVTVFGDRNAANLPPPVSFVGGASGVSAVSSYTATTLSVVVTAEPPEGGECFDLGAAQSEVLLQYQTVLIMLLVCMFAVVVFTVVLKKYHQREMMQAQCTGNRQGEQEAGTGADKHASGSRA